MKQDLLKMLLAEMSVSGEEFALQNQLKKYMHPYVDSCEIDSIGDGIYVLEGKKANGEEGKKILLSAHIDEIGLMITGATSDGYLKVTRIGAIKPMTYLGQGVQIRTENGIIYGSVQIHNQLKKIEDLSAKDILIDIGATSKEEALQAVRIGDVAAPDSKVRELLNGRIRARGLDDKSGVYAIMEALKGVREKGSVNTVIAAATVGEETCMHGAKWVAERTRPDEAIIVDVTFTTDYDGVRDAEWGEVQLGKGPAICLNPICDKRMNRDLMKIAEENDIPWQAEVSSGRSFTDADQIHFAGQGIPTAIVSIPLRYMHTSAEVADEKDLENVIRLLTAYLIK